LPRKPHRKKGYFRIVLPTISRFLAQIQRAFFPLFRAVFGGARGRTDVPKIVDWYMVGKVQIGPMIIHKLYLKEINK